MRVLLFIFALFFTMPSFAACDPGGAIPAGTISYDSAEHMMAYCDDTDWIRMGPDVPTEDWLQAGSSLSVSTFGKSITALDSSTVAFANGASDKLFTYGWDGNTWSQVGSAFTITPMFISSLAALDSSTVAFVGPGTNELRTYSWNGSIWFQVGNGFAITVLSPSLAALDNSTVALVDTNNNELRTYSWSGSDWSLVGSGFGIAGMSDPSLATLDGSTVALVVPAVSELRTYSWNGSVWSLVGTALSGVNGSAVASLGSNKVVVAGSGSSTLRTYVWDGSAWTTDSDSVIVSGMGSPSLTTLNSRAVAYHDDTNEELRTYKNSCIGPFGDESEIIYNSAYHVMQFCNSRDWIAMGPKVEEMTVFATSGTYNGDLVTAATGMSLSPSNGVDAADKICQKLAGDTGLTGNYLAWISDNNSIANSPAGLFAQSSLPYKLVDGTLIANNWADLTDGTLNSAISKDEFGNAITENVWTNVIGNGQGSDFSGIVTCVAWTDSSSGGLPRGVSGSSTSTVSWTVGAGDIDCDQLQRLYCFQQPDYEPQGSGCASPAGVEGEMIYNIDVNTMQYCNSFDWIGIRGYECDENMVLANLFTDQSGVALSSATNSNIAQLTGIGCDAGLPVNLSGDASGEFRICDDGTCSAAPAFGTTGTITSGQYLQLQVMSSASFFTTSDVTVDIGNKSDTWSVTTIPPPKRVFVSSSTYKGNGFAAIGVPGANTTCQNLADAQTLGGTWEAWLADATTVAPATRWTATIVGYTGEFQLVNGTKIADGWADLTDGSLDAPINRDEGGAFVSATNDVWTNVTSAGAEQDPFSNCVDWSFGGGGSSSSTGSTSLSTGAWTGTITEACTQTNHIYCFEQ